MKHNFSFKLDRAEGHKLKDGSYPVMLVVRKAGSRKNIYTGLSASYVEIKRRDGTKEIKSQWNDKFQRYEVDGRKELHPDRVKNNKWLDELSGRCDAVLKEFAASRTDWTLNQFQDALLNKSKKTGVESYFTQHIDRLTRAGKIGNKNAYQRTLDMIKLFDSKLSQRVFQEIDTNYVERFNSYLETERGCSGNTRKYYIKTLRSIMNKAIKSGEASGTTYPFGKHGFSIASLQQETEKRYLPTEYLDKLKAAELPTFTMQWVRNLFLFSYYCQGMSFIDVATLTKRNILVFEGGKYIAYRRHKTEGKNSRIIRVKISDNIQNLLTWFEAKTKLVEDHLLPIVSIPGYSEEKLYNHIRDRYRKYNKHLKTLAEFLEFEGIKLSSYVSRHSYAMRLKNAGIAEDVISEALGHKDLATTKIYLDSFQKDEIAKANEVL